MDRSLVVGGSGFLGSHVVDALLAKGHEVRILDLRPPLPDLAPVWKGVQFLHGDMLDAGTLETAVNGCTYVFHYGTTSIPKTSIADPELDNLNLVSTLRLLRVCRTAKVEKIVFPSSGGTVYGKPDRLPVQENAPLRPGSPYAATKIAVESHLAAAHRVHGQDYAVLRYGNPYGPRQDPAGKMGVVAVVFGLLQSGKTPTLYGDGSAVKDFFYATDAASAALAVLARSDEHVFNVGSGRGTSIRELFNAMGEVTGHPFEPQRAPSFPGDEPSYVLDIDRIRRSVGWQPRVDLSTGLRRTWEWIETRGA
jgi:UDP-glucose 4-epimerase